MQLDLEPHRQSVGEDPLRKLPGILTALARGKQHFASVGQGVLPEAVSCPFIVRTVADDELYLVVAREMVQVLISVPGGLPRFGGGALTLIPP